MLREYLPPDSAVSPGPSYSTHVSGDSNDDRVRNGGAPEPVSERPDGEDASVLAGRLPRTRLRSVFPGSARVPRPRG